MTCYEKPTIADLEQAIETGHPLEILPNGDVVTRPELEPAEPRPLTFRHDLGGEYAAA